MHIAKRIPGGGANPRANPRGWSQRWWASPTMIVLVSVAVKLLLIPSYTSTDFDVHRNWMAITGTLPLSQWFYEQSSEWTLDYPPFFAWFERLLSLGAPLADPQMLTVQAAPYHSPGTLVYQRLTVIASDAVLYGGIRMVTWSWPRSGTVETEWSNVKVLLVTALTFLNPGLLLVDHIHFQYNGFLLGILLASIALIRAGYDLAGAFLFALLLNFKHIFLYIAPVYFVYLLRHYCCTPANDDTAKNTRR